MKRRIGWFFGSFDPIHIGHLIVADTIRYQANLDQVRFVVSPLNPDKQIQAYRPIEWEHRQQMVAKAIESNRYFYADRIEYDMSHDNEPTYTANTLNKILEQHYNDQHFMLIGSDISVNIQKWYNYKYIIDNITTIVYPRGNAPSVTLQNGIVYNDVPMIDISSSLIRSRIQINQPIQYLVPPAIEDFIKHNSLYQ